MSSASSRADAWGRVVVIMPTYNEIDNVERVVRHLIDTVPQVDVLIVDDASPDGTGATADALAADPRIHALHRAGKHGLGTAYVEGFTWANARGYEVVVEMDADGSHPAETLPAMLDALVSGDPRPGLVIGSRWVPGGSVVNWPKYRLWLSRIANRYAKSALRLPVEDATGGFRAYPIGIASQIASTVDSRGYSFQIEMALRVHETGLPIVEVPIQFLERQAGHSKMSRSIVVEAMARVTVWGIQSRLRRRRP
ncbi:MAG: polyprenol monophosphomannose synthase [Glaciihabitans sp.]|nr:polyprenol monophosphomannose synthase [Glaciihabitans sp.]